MRRLRRAHVLRSTALGDFPMNPAIVDAIRKSAAVPSMPQVVTRFLEVIQDPDFDYDKLVKVLSVDAGTVSEILRLANSALFGVTRKVTSLKQALTLLGPRRTRSMVLGRYLVEAMGHKGRKNLDTGYFWRRSLVDSVVASRLAEKACPRLRDEAFLCGLLSDIGVAVLAEVLPEKYEPFASQFTAHGTPFTEAEELTVVGTSHAEVSALVLTEWALPESMCKAVRQSHDETVTGTEDWAQMARVVNAADRIGKLLCEIPDVNECVDVCINATTFAGVGTGVLVELLKHVESDVEELAGILKIDVIPSSVYSKIASAISERLAVAATA
jgi:HD-like signal output (HDOD) protein